MLSRKSLWRLLDYSSRAVACYGLNKVFLGQKLILILGNLSRDRVLHDPKRLTGMVANLKSNLHIIQTLVLSYCVVIFLITFSSRAFALSARSPLRNGSVSPVGNYCFFSCVCVCASPEALVTS